MELENNRVIKAPPTIYYIPEYITKEQEAALLKQIYDAPKPKWTQLSHRRLQNWGGLPHPKGMIAEPLPQWLQTCVKQLTKIEAVEDKIPNHVLINEYEAGQGIMPHEDGPLFYPTVATISLGSHTLLDFYHHLDNVEDNETQLDHSFESRHFISILLEPRSLILVKESMYKNYLHGIAERKEDTITDLVANLDLCPNVKLGDVLQRTTRVSLTIRHVPKVLKSKIFFK